MQESEDKVVEISIEDAEKAETNNLVVTKEIYESFVRRLADMYDEYGLSYPQIMEIITNHILSLSAFMVSKSKIKETTKLTHYARSLISEDKTHVISCDINIDLQYFNDAIKEEKTDEA